MEIKFKDNTVIKVTEISEYRFFTYKNNDGLEFRDLIDYKSFMEDYYIITDIFS